MTGNAVTFPLRKKNKKTIQQNVQDREINETKNQTPVRGQDGKMSDTREKDLYWSSTRRSLIGDQLSFPWVSEIFPSCQITKKRYTEYLRLSNTNPTTNNE
jgi:hypothetical protein